LEPTSADVGPLWADLGLAPDSFELRFIIAPKLRNLNKLDSIFWAVSDPRNAEYGHYLSREELSKLVSPSAHSLEMIEQWLAHFNIGIDDSHIGGDFLFVHASVAQLSKLLQTDFHLFQHKTNGAQAVRATQYSVPTALAAHIDLIVGISGSIRSPSLHKSHRRTTVGAGNAVTPIEIKSRYNITDIGDPSVTTKGQAVAEFQADYYSAHDLQTFYTTYVANNTAYNITKIVGPDAKPISTEANLDVEYIMTVAPNVPTWFYSYTQMSLKGFWEDLMTYASAIGNDTSAPYVHSISYGWQSTPQPSVVYKQRMNVEFQKLGTLGHTIIFASGDSGTSCVNNQFEPDFPGESPYITAVGATVFQQGNSGTEIAVTEFGSGGGFSKNFPAPSYQTSFVAHYFKVANSTLPPAAKYNATGRASPDVSMIGQNVAIIQGGKRVMVAGTSCSAPMFAGVVSLLNQGRLKANKPVLGFINPWLYQVAASNPNAFFDVTIGSNPGGCGAFHCAVGYDPVTGVGTPNYAVLKTLI